MIVLRAGERNECVREKKQSQLQHWSLEAEQLRHNQELCRNVQRTCSLLSLPPLSSETIEFCIKSSQEAIWLERRPRLTTQQRPWRVHSLFLLLIQALPIEYTYKTNLPARPTGHVTKSENWKPSGSQWLVKLERLRSVTEWLETFLEQEHELRYCIS